MSLPPGLRLGPYEILARLGAGGMGEVYRARDLALHRDVAIKTLPELFAADAGRVSRFEREAHTLAALNHPHIAQIHGLIGHADGGPALVMELVDGEDLAERIARGAIPLDEALPIARQVADALQAAHEQGIIHRDLKPANVRVRPDGTVKVLDFGLAKAVDTGPGGSGPDLAASPTFTSPAMTAMGVILGTAPYMAPEQARGRAVDRRADIWAFGCLFFEMITGRRAFGGDDVTDTITAVMRDDPDWQQLPAGLSPSTERFLRRCFAKNPRERVQDAGDLRLALEGAFDVPSTAGGGPSAATMTRRPAWMRPASLAAATLAVALLAGTAGWWAGLAPPPADARIRRFLVSPDPAALAIASANRDLVISPDGTLLAYLGTESAVRGLYVRRVDSLTPTLLRRSERYFEPFISHDSRWIAFNDETDYTLRKVPATGGPPVAIAKTHAEMLGASWADDDTIVYATQEGLWRVPAGGGTPQVVIQPDLARGERSLAWPIVLPGSKTVVYAARSGGRSDESAIHALDLQTGTTKLLVPGGTNPLYSPTGHLLYMTEQVLHGVAFDARRVETRGDAMPLLEGIFAKASGGANISLAADGTLAYLSGDGGSASRVLLWLDRQGRTEPLNLPPRPYGLPRISPDGTRIAVDLRREPWEVWMWDVARQVFSRLTTASNSDSHPVWTPDARQLLFASSREGPRRLFVQAADGTGEARRLDEEAFNPDSLTPDGRQVIFRRDGGNGSDLMMAAIDGSGEAVPLVATSANEVNGEVSPDGRWLAYQSDESGQAEVYVRPFPGVAGGRWQISYGGGRHPMWGRDARELFFVEADGRLAAVRVMPGEAFVPSRPERVSEVAFFSGFVSRSYDISPDGKRFLVVQTVPDGQQLSIVIVENWTQELKRLTAR
jgi:eukaryotic-like serine/threonine-protein kinase